MFTSVLKINTTALWGPVNELFKASQHINDLTLLLRQHGQILSQPGGLMAKDGSVVSRLTKMLLVMALCGAAGCRQILEKAGAKHDWRWNNIMLINYSQSAGFGMYLRNAVEEHLLRGEVQKCWDKLRFASISCLFLDLL